MLDFSLSAEQREVQQLARRLALEHLRPQARAAERRGDSAPELWQALAQVGLLTPFPEAYGGSGPLEAMTHVLIAEELGYGDAGLAMGIIGSLIGPLTIALAGSTEQQTQILPPFCAQDTQAQQRGSLAVAEFGGGYTCAAIQTSARYDGQSYHLTGTKRAVIYGQNAATRVVLFRLEQSSDTAGLCAALLPESLAGLTIQREEQKLGLMAAPSATYQFQDAFLPQTALLGAPGNSGVLRALSLYQLLRAAVACGTTRAALHYTGQYAQERHAFGRPIVSYQSIAFLLVDMALQLDAVRLLLWQLACNWDRGLTDATFLHDGDMIQQQAIKLAQSATRDAVQIMGGAGFLQDHPVELWMRAAAAME